MNLWSADAATVVGGVIGVPVRANLAQGAPSQASAGRQGRRYGAAVVRETAPCALGSEGARAVRGAAAFGLAAAAHLEHGLDVAGITGSKLMAELSRVRRSVLPNAGEGWAEIAGRALPELPRAEAVGRLQSWNLHVFMRAAFQAGAAGNPILPSDVIFVEPPPPRA